MAYDLVRNHSGGAYDVRDDHNPDARSGTAAMSNINNGNSRLECGLAAPDGAHLRSYAQRGVTYLLAATVPLIVLWLCMRLPFPLDQHLLLVLFVPAILLIALVGGVGPTLVATFSTALVVNLFLLSPTATLAISAPHDLLQWMVLILSGILAGAGCY